MNGMQAFIVIPKGTNVGFVVKATDNVGIDEITVQSIKFDPTGKENEFKSQSTWSAPSSPVTVDVIITAKDKAGNKEPKTIKIEATNENTIQVKDETTQESKTITVQTTGGTTTVTKEEKSEPAKTTDKSEPASPETKPVFKTIVSLLASDASSLLYYKVETAGNKDIITSWSPDNTTWMDLKTLTVSGGSYNGQKPTQKNQQFINSLSAAGSGFDFVKEVVQKNPDYMLSCNDDKYSWTDKVCGDDNFIYDCDSVKGTYVWVKHSTNCAKRTDKRTRCLGTTLNQILNGQSVATKAYCSSLT
jgi:hypothetical protein